jgi:hypothetical protein
MAAMLDVLDVKASVAMNDLVVTSRGVASAQTQGGPPRPERIKSLRGFGAVASAALERSNKLPATEAKKF